MLRKVATQVKVRGLKNQRRWEMNSGSSHLRSFHSIPIVSSGLFEAHAALHSINQDPFRTSLQGLTACPAHKTG